MPAHSNNNFDAFTFAFWQQLWPFFVQQNFILYTSQTQHLFKVGDNSALFITHPYCAFQKLSSVNQGIDFIFELKKYTSSVLHTQLATLKKLEQEAHLQAQGWKVEFTWNYLGKPQERLLYIDYLTELFWKNQSDEFLCTHPHFSEMLISPWKMPLFADSLPYSFAHPVEFFSDNTTTFFQNLEKTMHGWTLNPYFVWHMYGSLQWTIRINNTFEICGALWQDAGKMYHEIKMHELVLESERG